MHAILITKDLLLGSQIAGAAKAAGCELTEVPSAERLRAVIANTPATHVVIDLTCAGVRDDLATLVPELKSADSPATVIAYGPHVQEGALNAASSAGCDRVLTKGQLSRELNTLFA